MVNAPARFIVGKNHFAHSLDPVALKKHMFGATQADAFASECFSYGGLIGLVRIGADAELGGSRVTINEEGGADGHYLVWGRNLHVASAPEAFRAAVRAQSYRSVVTFSSPFEVRTVTRPERSVR